MKSIIVTGASGFVGSNIIPFLSANGFNVISCSRSNSSGYSYLNSSFINRTNAFGIIHLAGKAHDVKKTSNPEEYYTVNYEITKKIFDAFLQSEAILFIYLSSVKAVSDYTDKVILTEDLQPNPQTDYGRSKLKAEQYIQQSNIPENKRLFILRPTMIHGPGNKGNLNLLFDFVKKGIPYPLGAFQNQRSYLSIDNLNFVLKEIIERNDISPGVYNITDDMPVSTNQIIRIIANKLSKKISIWHINKQLIKMVARFGDFLPLPLNSERLQKMTENYVVSNNKLLENLNKPLPLSSEFGLEITFKSFVSPENLN